jgi:carboxyl-terminal processing protease
MSNDTASTGVLTEPQRRKIFDTVLGVIDRYFFLPNSPTPDTRRLREEHEAAIVQAADRDVFESLVQRAIGTVASHHIGFFHAERARTSASAALAVTAVPTSTDADGSRWRFQFVHADGPAAKAGITKGDLLLTIDGDDITAPGRLLLAHGRSYKARVRKPNGLVVETVIDLPIITSRKKAPPVVQPQTPVTARKLDRNTGLIHISMFPGVIGIDVSRDITRAVRELSAEQLIFDVRGNTGGGVGALRVMSHLCADQRGVGYSVSRALLERGYQKEALPRFNHIPDSKVGLVPIIARYLYWKMTGRAESVALFTEGLGAQIHHGKTALLIDQSSASAAEMIAAFASEYRLATLVGTDTPGRLASSGIKKVGFGYRLMLPTGGYITWNGRLLEPGKGIKPDVQVPIDPDSILGDEDNQLAAARAALSN